MLKLAWSNLTHERTRLAISVGGVALAVLLIFTISGVFAGSQERAVAYIDNQPVPLWMMQAGVENIHMASSTLPPNALDEVRQNPDVQQAEGVLYVSASVEIGEEVIPSYLFGIDPAIDFGGPWLMASGRANMDTNEIVIDQALAKRYDLAIGDTIQVLGSDLTIIGFSKDTFGIAINIAFVNRKALAAAMGISPKTTSYILIQPSVQADIDTLSAQLETAVPASHVITKASFITSEQDLIRQMGTDVILAMSMVAYVIGMLVIGLTVYTATLERAREYGVLKAIGARNRNLVSVVFAQAFFTAALGYGIGVGLTYGFAAVIIRLVPELLIVIQPDRLLQEMIILSGVTAVAALLPISRLARLEPVSVFRE